MSLNGLIISLSNLSILFILLPSKSDDAIILICWVLIHWAILSKFLIPANLTLPYPSSSLQVALPQICGNLDGGKGERILQVAFPPLPRRGGVSNKKRVIKCDLVNELQLMHSKNANILNMLYYCASSSGWWCVARRSKVAKKQRSTVT